MPSPAAGVRAAAPGLNAMRPAWTRCARPERSGTGHSLRQDALDPGFQCVTPPAASAAPASWANPRTTSTTSTGREVGAGDHRPLEVSDRRVGERDAAVEW